MPRRQRRPVQPRLGELSALIERLTGADGAHETSIPELTRYRLTAPSTPTPCLYEPSVCLIAQGRKRVLLGDEAYVCARSPIDCWSVSSARDHEARRLMLGEGLDASEASFRVDYESPPNSVGSTAAPSERHPVETSKRSGAMSRPCRCDPLR